MKLEVLLLHYGFGYLKNTLQHTIQTLTIYSHFMRENLALLTVNYSKQCLLAGANATIVDPCGNKMCVSKRLLLLK